MTIETLLPTPDIFSAKWILAEAVMFAGLTKIAAVRCYQAQFEPDDMDLLVMVLDMKSRWCGDIHRDRHEGQISIACYTHIVCRCERWLHQLPAHGGCAPAGRL
jgi:hypothetical protein